MWSKQGNYAGSAGLWMWSLREWGSEPYSESAAPSAPGRIQGCALRRVRYTASGDASRANSGVGEVPPADTRHVNCERDWTASFR